MPFATKMGLSTTGYQTGRSSKRAAERFKNRRKTKEGYPVTVKFKTLDEVKEYLSGETIPCLICGHHKRKLGGYHLSKIHNISDDEYRERFGIPWSYPLASSDCSGSYSKAVLRRMKDPKYRENLLVYAKTARDKMAESPHIERPSSLAVKARNIEGLNNPRSKAENNRIAEIFLGRISKGRTPQEVGKDEDMISWTWWNHYKNRNPEYKDRFDKIFEKLPFRVQARGQRLGVRFKKELRILFDQGLSDKKAAAILGVTAMSCNRTTKIWRKENDK